MKGPVLLLLMLLSAWGLAAQTLVVAAASNLVALEKPLKEAFAQAYPGRSLQFSFGASGTLVTQMLNGAPYQAFLSADRDFAQKLVDAGLATGPVTTYALGKLIFLSTTPLPAGAGLGVVSQARVAQFAVANPQTAPYGRAAVEALTKAGLYAGVKAKQVTAQNITQAVQFTLSTGFGFVNKSAVLAKDLAAYSEQGRFWFEVDPSLYSPIEQGFVVLKPYQAAPEGKAFAEFLVSPSAQKVFLAFGYGKP